MKSLTMFYAVALLCSVSVLSSCGKKIEKKGSAGDTTNIPEATQTLKGSGDSSSGTSTSTSGTTTTSGTTSTSGTLSTSGTTSTSDTTTTSGAVFTNPILDITSGTPIVSEAAAVSGGAVSATAASSEGPFVFQAIPTVSTQVNLFSTNVSSASVQCIESLCGAQYPMPHPFDVAADYKAATENYVNQTMTRSVELYMGQLIHFGVASTNLFKKLNSAFSGTQGNAKISPEKKAFFLAINTLGTIQNYPMAMGSDNNGFHWDTAKLASMYNVPAEQIKALVALEPVISMTASVQYYEEMDMRDLYSMLLPGVVQDQQQVKFALALEQTIQQNSQFLPFPMFLNTRSLILTRAKNNERLSVAEEKSLKDLFISQGIISRLIQTDIITEFKALPITSAQILQIANTTYTASESGKAFADPKTVKGIFKTSVSQCMADLAHSHGALPTLQQKQYFLAGFEDIKKEAVKMLAEKGLVDTTLQTDVSIDLPPAREEVASNWQYYLNIDLQNYSAVTKSIEQLDLSQQQNMESALIYYAVFAQQNIFSDVLSFCQQTEPATLDDHADPQNNVIHISWPTVVYPSQGFGIISHELGHIVSAKYQAKTINEKTCLMSKQKSQQYVEEDFADLFSSELTNRIADKVEQTQVGVFGCSLVNFENGQWDGSKDLVNPIKEDVHSAGMYRLLAIAQMKGKMTNECQNFLSLQKDTRFANYCKWQK